MTAVPSTTPEAGSAPAPAPAPGPGDAVATAISRLLPLLQAAERDDLVARCTAAAARLRRPSTIVCVVGEFKQGKSSLVNGLLGRAICPVDDDLATAAITLVRHGDPPSAIARRRADDGSAVSEPVAVEDLVQWVSEVGNPGNEKRVERLDVTLPSPVLAQGLAIVDTPGMGGMGAGHAAATLAFLPFADGLLFVSDASTELTSTEVDFLRQATDLCPTVLVVQTKIDLYAFWSRIVDLNRGHLAGAGLPVPVVAVSNTLRAEAMSRRDRDLNSRSGYPALLEALGSQVVEPAKAVAAQRSAGDALDAISLVTTGLEAEQQLLLDPSRRTEALAALEAAKERLEHLRGPGSRWGVLLGDRVADLSTQVNHRLRGSIRTLLRATEERIESLRTPEEWDEVARSVQTEIANHVTDAFVAIEAGAAAIHQEIIELLQEEDLGLLGGSRSAGSVIDVKGLWSDKALDPKEKGKAFRTGLTGIRGAQSGVMMFGMVGQFLPGAAAVLLASNPVLLGIGAVFGGVQLFDDRKRKIAGRRQAARSQVRQFLDDVQFEIGDEVAGQLRDVQRRLRDEFTERLTELQRTYTDTAKRAQASAEQDATTTEKRSRELTQSLAGLAQVGEALTAAVGR